MEYKGPTFNSFEKGFKLFFLIIYCLLKSFIILWEIWTILRQQMANERLGTSKLSHVFLKIYPYDPTPKFQE